VPSRGSLHGTTAFAIGRLARAHRAAVAPRLAALGLNSGAELLLAELWREDGIMQSELAERLAVRPPSVTKVVRGLAAQGFVERRVHPDDARISLVFLTRAGRALRAEVESAWAEAERETLGVLPRSDAKQLRRLLARATP
jgi:DNA-binding MarR family transcriptional regulator